MYNLQLTHILVVQLSHSTQVKLFTVYVHDAFDLFSSAAYFLWCQWPDRVSAGELWWSCSVGSLCSVSAFEAFSPQQQAGLLVLLAGLLCWKEHVFLITHSLPHLCSAGPLLLVLSFPGPLLQPPSPLSSWSFPPSRSSGLQSWFWLIQRLPLFILFGCVCTFTGASYVLLWAPSFFFPPPYDYIRMLRNC